MGIDNDEKLLDSWLTLYASLKKDRLVRDIPFNEACILSLLCKKGRQCPANPMLSASELCDGTGLLKSQMNRTLNDMEKKQYIIRFKSKTDKRMVFVSITPKGKAVYQKEHDHILQIVRKVSSNLGDERSSFAADTFDIIADTLKHIERW